MKKIVVSLVAMMFLFAPMAFGLTIEDVVQADELLHSTTLTDSGDPTELNWINDSLKTDFTSLNKFEFDDKEYVGDDKNENWVYDYWKQVDNSSIWAFDFGTEMNPGYFLIKVGAKVFLKSNDTEYTHFLFENFDAARYAAVNLDLFYTKTETGGKKSIISIQDIDIEKFSHISYPGGTPVPEPATLLLFGAGIAGLALYRRKRS